MQLEFCLSWFKTRKTIAAEARFEKTEESM